MRLNKNLRWKITWSIHLATRYRNKNSNLMLQKKDAIYQWITKLNQNKHFAITSVGRVAVFQTSLRLLRDEVGAKLSNKDNKHSTSKYCHEEGC